jgi:hypothetical protein
MQSSCKVSKLRVLTAHTMCAFEALSGVDSFRDACVFSSSFSVPTGSVSAAGGAVLRRETANSSRAPTRARYERMTPA